MTPEPVLDARGRSYWRELGLGVSGDAVGRGTEKNPASLGQDLRWGAENWVVLLTLGYWDTGCFGYHGEAAPGFWGLRSWQPLVFGFRKWVLALSSCPGGHILPA